VIEVGEDTTSLLVDKLLDIEATINQEAGSLVLFALIEREDAPGKWDLVVSAAWAKQRQKDLLNRIALQIRNKLTWEERITLSRILILDPVDPFVRAVNNMVNDIEHDKRRMSNFLVNGVSIKDSYIMTSQRPEGL
jgi:hypothetical protein